MVRDLGSDQTVTSWRPVEGLGRQRSTLAEHAPLEEANQIAGQLIDRPLVDLPADHPIGELYDMHADPGETNNLWDERQDVVKQLLALLEKYQRQGRSVPANP